MVIRYLLASTVILFWRMVRLFVWLLEIVDSFLFSSSSSYSRCCRKGESRDAELIVTDVSGKVGRLCHKNFHEMYEF